MTNIEYQHIVSNTGHRISQITCTRVSDIGCQITKPNFEISDTEYDGCGTMAAIPTSCPRLPATAHYQLRGIVYRVQVYLVCRINSTPEHPTFGFTECRIPGVEYLVLNRYRYFPTHRILHIEHGTSNTSFKYQASNIN